MIIEKLYDIKELTLDWSSRIKWKFLHRTTNKHHIVHTGLTPGYHDADEVILHTNFTLLVDFVECDKAWMNYICTKESSHPFPWWQRPFKRFRSKQLGLDYLRWEIEESGSPTKADAAPKILELELYHWWTEVRPARPDPYEKYYRACSSHQPEGSLFEKVYNKETNEYSFVLAPMHKKVSKALRQGARLEEMYYEEDTKMLCKLMKVRQHLWT